MKEKLVWKIDGKVIGEVTPCDIPMAKSHYKVEFSLDKRNLQNIPLNELKELHIKQACKSLIEKLPLEELEKIFNVEVTDPGSQQFKEKLDNLKTPKYERAFLNEVALNDVIHFLIITK